MAGGKVNILEEYLNSTINPCWNYAKRITDWDGHVTNAAMGLASESGETLDIVKKMLFHTEKPLEFFRPKLVSELGDVVFYYTKLLEVLGISLEEVLQANREKLMSRHPELGAVDERFGEGFIK